MLKLILLSIVTSIAVTFIFVPNISATNSDVMISQIQLGDLSSASNEFIEIYNNSTNEINVTDWCLKYQSSSLVSRQLVCFNSDGINSQLILPAYSYALAVSKELVTSDSPIIGDFSFSATLSATAGYVKLFDNLQNEIESVGWGDDEIQNDIIEPPAKGYIMSRIISNEDVKVLQDTNINVNDFEIIPPRLVYDFGFIYELPDFCSNIDGLQSGLPDGYVMGANGNCEKVIVVDICQNIEGIQIVEPDGHFVDLDNNCYADQCINIDGIQQTIPEGMVKNGSDNCIEDEAIDDLEPNELPLQITELLPNSKGSDIGNEFIEIYNPNDFTVILDDYVFYIGKDNFNKYKFPKELSIEPKEYLAIYNDLIKFTLLNSSSVVKLKLVDDTLIDESDDYIDPKEDMSWSLIDGVWQYTNRLTPGSVNLVSYYEVEPDEVELIQDEVSEKITTVGLAPCAPNQYRNPETNRCKLIVEPSSTLAPCKEGQYRSEETNRCRNIVSDIVAYMPCAEGEERNPETNRCRKVAVLGASDLAPCPEGQERNPETNRCRNVVKPMPEVGYAPEQVTADANNHILWWSLFGVGLIAASYGIWEWRQEIIKIVGKIGIFLHIVK